MTYQIKRECGCLEKINFTGSNAAWREREILLKRLPCCKCHTKRIKERVSAGVPSLTEICLGS